MIEPTNRPPPVALTVAGSDSGGGAGIQADLKTFHQFGVFGTSALTAVTAQNTVGVDAVHVVPPAVVEAQILAVTEDLAPVSAKTGMLATAAHVELVSGLAASGLLPRLVVDPVMVATSGDRLLDADAERILATGLLPHATLVTPNLVEAEILLGREFTGGFLLEDAARALVDMGAGAALVKGGHAAEDDDALLTDVLYDGSVVHRFTHVRHSTPHTHGTGCTLSAAITAELALGTDLATAVERGVRFVSSAIRTAPGLGRGHGPVNHFAPRGD